MLSENLKRIRKEHKFTQQDIADVLGIDRSTYTFYETAKTSPSIDTLKKLSNIYNVTIGYLVGCEENKPELKLKHMNYNFNNQCADPIAFLDKDEQTMLMFFRVLASDKKQDIIKQIKNLAAETAE